MVSMPELQVQQKREMEKGQEGTLPARVFLPNADIYESEDALTLVLEMPGVDKGNVEVGIQDGVLKISGRLDFGKYEGLQPVYTEYNVGDYARTFRLSNQIDQAKISAQMQDGVLTLVLPKVEEAKARSIPVR